jgi:hypothetical protein
MPQLTNFIPSEDEDEDAMDVDPKPKPSADDLTEYNLDDYDNDVKTDGMFSAPYLQSLLTPSSCWSIQ